MLPPVSLTTVLRASLRTGCLALLVMTVGCGTMTNMHKSTRGVAPEPFGGLATDFEAIGNGDLLGMIDIPGSLVGDLVTLPEVMRANQVEKRLDAAPSEGSRRSQTPPADPLPDDPLSRRN
ncbi:MAG: hypothetical protein JSS02_03160 [Planctomycetes bacterium]|nr:hypothetical protein [Planctomycetota bacterium]